MNTEKVMVAKQKLQFKEFFDLAILREQLTLLMDINTMVLHDQKIGVIDKSN